MKAKIAEYVIRTVIQTGGKIVFEAVKDRIKRKRQK